LPRIHVGSWQLWQWIYKQHWQPKQLSYFIAITQFFSSVQCWNFRTIYVKVATGLAENSCWELATVAMDLQTALAAEAAFSYFIAITQFFSSVQCWNFRTIYGD
jgi:hypothetical protein